MRINDYLKRKRTKMGISDKKFAEITGKNIYWVEDFDGDEEELNGLNILQFQKMCKTLKILPQEVFLIVASDLKILCFKS